MTGLREENIKTGFECTIILLVNSSKYTYKQFDGHLLINNCNTGVANRKPETDESIKQSINHSLLSNHKW